MNTLALRVTLLAALLFALNAWAVRHTGTEVTHFAALNGFIMCVTLVLGWIDQQEADSLRGQWNAILRRCVEPQVLIPLYLFALLGTSLLSSVTVMADGETRRTEVYLSPEGGPRDEASIKTLEGPSDVVRYLRFTSLFGRPLYVEAAGYQRHGFSLKPWTGTSISLRTDLQRLPTVLLRIPLDLLSALKDSKLMVEVQGTGAVTTIPLSNEYGSVMIGTVGEIPSAWRQEWRSELSAIQNMPSVLLETILRRWRNPVRDESVAGLVPGQRLLVRLVTGNDDEYIRQEVVIGSQLLQDIALARKDTPR